MLDLIDLNEYQKMEKIGSGLFGEVYKIKDRQSGQLYAAKVSFSTMDNIIDNYHFSIIDFEREITLISKIHHPLILNFIGLSMTNFKGENKPTIITDFLPNGSLSDVIKKNPEKLNDTKKLIIIYGIAVAMSFLNSHNIVHLDLKPSHILIDEKFHPVISDFGLSVDLKDIKNNLFEIRGTPLYISPEILENLNYSIKSDVFSYALILFQIFTNEVPFRKMSLYQLNEAICEGKRPDASSVPEPYKNLIERCWLQDPEKRPSFENIVDEIESNKDFILNSIDEDEFLEFVNNIKNCQKYFDVDAAPFVLNDEIISSIKPKNEICNDDDYESLEKEIKSLRIENHKLKEENRQLAEENDQLKKSNDIEIFDCRNINDNNKNCSDCSFSPRNYSNWKIAFLFLAALFIIMNIVRFIF